jgi:hypothetical protein
MNSCSIGRMHYTADPAKTQQLHAPARGEATTVSVL